MPIHHLRLYVSGDSPNGRAARTNADRLCGMVVGGCEITVIDVLSDPAAAEAARVIATPLLASLDTNRRVIGDLSDLEQVIAYFEMVIDAAARGGGDTARTAAS